MSATIESIQAEAAVTPTDPWRGFTGGRWQDHVDVHDFIQANVAPYIGDAAFLAGPTERTRALWARVYRDVPARSGRVAFTTWTLAPPRRSRVTLPDTSTGSRN